MARGGMDFPTLGESVVALHQMVHQQQQQQELAKSGACPCFICSNPLLLTASNNFPDPMSALRLRARSLATISRPTPCQLAHFMADQPHHPLLAVDQGEEQWQPVTKLEEEAQLEGLARIYRCSVAIRSDVHVLLNCSQLGTLRCQFKLLLLRKELMLFVKGQHNHAQTSPLWELPEAGANANGQLQAKQAQKRRRRTMKGWRFLGEVCQESGLRQFGHWWRPYQKNKLVLRCLRDTKCGYRMCWHRGNFGLYESGEHRHGGGETAGAEGGEGQERNTGGEVPEKRQKLAHQGQQEVHSSVSIHGQVNQNLLFFAPMPVHRPGQPLPILAQFATPPYKTGGAVDGPSGSSKSATSSYEALTPEGMAEEDSGGRQVEDVQQGNSAIPRLPQLEEDGEIVIGDSEDEGEEGEDGEEDGHGQKQQEQKAEEEQNGEKQANQQEPGLEGGEGEEEAVMEGQRDNGEEALEEGRGGGEAGENGTAMQTDGQESAGQNVPYDGDQEQQGEEVVLPSSGTSENGGQGQVAPFRLADLQGQLRDIASRFGLHFGLQKGGDVMCLSHLEESEGVVHSSDSLLFEDQGQLVKVTETRAKQWHWSNAKITGKWAKQCQRWTKADREQFLLAVRGICDQLLLTQPQWE